MALRTGSYRGDAARRVGIAEHTLYEWISRGRDDFEAGIDSPCCQLFRDIQKAEADAKVNALALIAKAANNGAWQAAAWMLERKNPEQWGKRERVQVEGNVDHTLSVSILPDGKQPVDIPAEKRREAARLLLAGEPEDPDEDAWIEGTEEVA
jgi:hypothetical protein